MDVPCSVGADTGIILRALFVGNDCPSSSGTLARLATYWPAIKGILQATGELAQLFWPLQVSVPLYCFLVSVCGPE